MPAENSGRNPTTGSFTMVFRQDKESLSFPASPDLQLPSALLVTKRHILDEHILDPFNNRGQYFLVVLTGTLALYP